MHCFCQIWQDSMAAQAFAEYIQLEEDKKAEDSPQAVEEVDKDKTAKADVEEAGNCVGNLQLKNGHELRRSEWMHG